MKAALILGLGLAGLLPSWSALAQDDDWPCVQRLVPSISAAALWPFPELLPASIADWREQEILTESAQLLAHQGESAFSTIVSLAAAAPPATRNQQLAVLFALVVDLLNNQREQQLRLIIDFARRQRELAKKIIADQDALATDDDDIAQRLVWDTRVYDEREKRLRLLCERPVLLEQRAFQVGRAIAAQITEP